MTFKYKIDPSGHRVLINFANNLDKAKAKQIMLIAEHAAGIIRETIYREWLDQSTWGLSTGALARSFRPTLIRKRKLLLEAGVFSKRVYAGIHEEGGIIYPARAKNLAIPLTRAARRVSPRNFPRKLVFVISRLGNKLLVEKLKTKIKPQYLLEPSTKIHPKRYLEKSLPIIEKRLATQWEKVTGNAWSASIVRVRGG